MDVLTIEQIEQCRVMLKALTVDASKGRPDEFKMKQPEWSNRVDALCNMATGLLHDEIKNLRNIIIEQEGLKTEILMGQNPAGFSAQEIKIAVQKDKEHSQRHTTRHYDSNSRRKCGTPKREIK